MEDPPRSGDASAVALSLERQVGSLSVDADAVETTLWLVALAALALDLYTTYLGLGAGLVEGNPVMHWAIDGLGFGALVLAKLLVVAGAATLRDVRPRYGPTIALGLAVPWVLAVVLNVAALAAL